MFARFCGKPPHLNWLKSAELIVVMLGAFVLGWMAARLRILALLSEPLKNLLSWELHRRLGSWQLTSLAYTAVEGG